MRDVIETTRLKLRTLRANDASRIARYVGDPVVGRNLAMTPLPYLENAAEGWIMTLAARAPLKHDFVRAIETRADGLVGVIGAHKRSNGSFEIGYWIGRPFWGRGVATEALLAFAEEARALGPLQSGHFVDNPASGRVLAKGGFVYTGAVEPMFSLARGTSVPCKRMRDGAMGTMPTLRETACC